MASKCSSSTGALNIVTLSTSRHYRCYRRLSGAERRPHRIAHFELGVLFGSIAPPQRVKLAAAGQALTLVAQSLRVVARTS
jgi:hypothetical protein